MDSTHAETRNALRVLTQKLIESKDTSFTSQGSGSLYRMCVGGEGSVCLCVYVGVCVCVCVGGEG